MARAMGYRVRGPAPRQATSSSRESGTSSDRIEERRRTDERRATGDRKGLCAGGRVRCVSH